MDYLVHDWKTESQTDGYEIVATAIFYRFAYNPCHNVFYNSHAILLCSLQDFATIILQLYDTCYDSHHRGCGSTYQSTWWGILLLQFVLTYIQFQLVTATYSLVPEHSISSYLLPPVYIDYIMISYILWYQCIWSKRVWQVTRDTH